jgi:hypothetical protein
LLCQVWQGLAGVEVAGVGADFTAEVLLAAVALVVAAISAAVLAPRQPSTAVAFEEHQSPGVHILPAEMLADQVPHLDSIMVVIACLPCGRRDSLAQLGGLPGRISAALLQLLDNQTA